MNTPRNFADSLSLCSERRPQVLKEQRTCVRKALGSADENVYGHQSVIIRPEPLSKGKKSKARDFSHRLSIVTVLQGGRAWWVLQEEGLGCCDLRVGRGKESCISETEGWKVLQWTSAVDKAWVALGLQLVKQNAVAWRSWEGFLSAKDIFTYPSRGCQIHRLSNQPLALHMPTHLALGEPYLWQPQASKHLAFESGQSRVWGWSFSAWSRENIKHLGKDLVEISWLSDELNQRKCGRQTMPSPQGQSVGLTQDCRAMPLSSGSSDTYIWKHLLSFKEKNITQRPVLSSSFQNYFSLI